MCTRLNAATVHRRNVASSLVHLSPIPARPGSTSAPPAANVQLPHCDRWRCCEAASARTSLQCRCSEAPFATAKSDGRTAPHFTRAGAQPAAVGFFPWAVLLAGGCALSWPRRPRTPLVDARAPSTRLRTLLSQLAAAAAIASSVLQAASATSARTTTVRPPSLSLCFTKTGEQKAGADSVRDTERGRRAPGDADVGAG